MNNNHFFIHLSSICSQNTFIFSLPSILNLENDNWSVALEEIHIPKAIKLNIGSFKYGNSVVKETNDVEIPSGYYDEISLAKTLNKQLIKISNKRLRKISRNKNERQKNRRKYFSTRFTFNVFTKKFSIKTFNPQQKNLEMFSFDRNIADNIGYHGPLDTFIQPKRHNFQTVNSLNYNRQLIITINLIKDSFFSGQFIPVLKTIKFDYNEDVFPLNATASHIHDSVNTINDTYYSLKSFEKHFISCKKQIFENIKINILDSNLNNILFDKDNQDKIYLTLHFKKNE